MAKSEYVKRRLAEIKNEQKPKRARRKKTIKSKSAPLIMQTTGFYLSMDFNPNCPLDQKIITEANNLICRRAK